METGATHDKKSHVAREELAHKLDEMWDEIRDLRELAKAAARETVKGARDGVRDIAQHGRDRVTAVEGGFEDTVRKSPMQSILIAGGVGLLLGLFWRR